MNRLPLHRVDEILRHFDAGLGVRETARATGHARATVVRYRRLWNGSSPSEQAFVVRIDSETVRLLRLATGPDQPTGIIIGNIVKAVVRDGVAALVLA